MFLKWFWIRVTNIQVISKITKNNCPVTPVSVYSQPSVQLLLFHICISVLASLSTVLLFDYIINCSIDMNNFVVYQHFIFSEFNHSWLFLKQFLPIVITMQVLHIIFNKCIDKMPQNKATGIDTIPHCTQLFFIVHYIRKYIIWWSKHQSILVIYMYHSYCT